MWDQGIERAWGIRNEGQPQIGVGSKEPWWKWGGRENTKAARLALLFLVSALASARSGTQEQV